MVTDATGQARAPDRPGAEPPQQSGWFAAPGDAADREAGVILLNPSPAEPTPALGYHEAHAMAQAATARAIQLRQQTEQVLAQAQAIHRITAEARSARWSGAAAREVLQRSEHARLLARLATMPVIEQAKGIIMAQSRCGEAEAFGVLRRASQRSNVPVRVLAAQIVANTAGTATAAAPEPDRQGRTSTNPGTRRLPSGAGHRPGAMRRPAPPP